MRIAAAQIVTGEDPQQNLSLVREWTAQAAQAGADLVVFPEATQRAFGYPLGPVAETAWEWAEEVHLIAQRHGIVVVLGMFTPGEPAEPGGRPRVRNTLLATGPSVYVSYDKLHLYDAFGFQESRTVEPGERRVSFDTRGVRIGLATCYDIRFPQLFQAYANDGAHLSLVPASWQTGPRKVEQWRTLATARALDSTQYVVACGQGLPEAAGVQAPEKAPTGVGHSLIVSPTGEILAEAGEAPELLIADIDMATVDQARQALPVLANARTDLGL
ncbi:carbon-nitrogen hydrolase family protein [Nesterenkonia alkaliphila]|uniref:Hydrolase n=1 Tax=Nesterenkonia alkaliphila TaxID=1463631 RepID=A0A7K1UJ89_9MICC|nr:carbon-nitrogen hydrolase family protein [Nesterenkonia alkaliphila]MVT26543.1 hydrolase [Nesterenkonia alkaliphila]GFZ79033.1 apolipoprotein acyltransferase [Nesterenkonia alkaliphila]